MTLVLDAGPVVALHDRRDRLQESVERLLRAEDYRTIAQLDAAYASLSAGLTDLSIVVLAARFGTRRILTFDERRFRTLRPLDGGVFILLPEDSFRRSPVS